MLEDGTEADAGCAGGTVPSKAGGGGMGRPLVVDFSATSTLVAAGRSVDREEEWRRVVVGCRGECWRGETEEGAYRKVGDAAFGALSMMGEVFNMLCDA